MATYCAEYGWSSYETLDEGHRKNCNRQSLQPSDGTTYPRDSYLRGGKCG